MKIDMNELLEQAIVGKLIQALTDEGFNVKAVPQECEYSWIYAWPCELENEPETYDHWVKLVYGNGCDIISDYSMSLETVIKPVNDFTELFR